MDDLRIARDLRVPLAERIAAGSRLWDLADRAKKSIEVLKKTLRVEARKNLRGATGAVTLEGSGMTRAVVTFETFLEVVEGTDYDALRGALGEAFGDLFEKEVRYKLRPGVTERIRSLPPNLQNKVFEVLREVEGTPRVSLQFGGEGIEVSR